MKNRTLIIALLVTSLLFMHCKKQNILEQRSSILYSSEGNFLILNISDKLVEAYEFQIEIDPSIKDTIPLFFESVHNSIYIETAAFLNSTNDTLYKSKNFDYSFLGQPIPLNKLGITVNQIPFSSVQPQLYGTVDSSKIQDVWEKVYRLSIVNHYHQEKEARTIGFQRIVQNFYNENLGFSVPEERHLIYLLK
jgi:hypothetical protein